MLGFSLYLLFGIGLVVTNLMNLPKEDEIKYQQLKTQAPQALLIGLIISVLFWAPILIFGLFFARKKEEE